MNEVLIIIPAYNEEKSIASLIGSIGSVGPGWDVCVVNDCSGDNTSKLLKQLGVRHINLSNNLGIGGAVQTGYKYALRHGYKYAIQVDGDGQHDPKDIPKLIEKSKEGFHFVVGSRFIDRDGFQSTLSRRFGIKIFSLVIRMFFGEKMTDATSGFRLADQDVIAEFAQNYPVDYPEPETIVMLMKKKYRVAEVPVVMRARAQGDTSIDVFDSVYYMVKVTLAMVFAFFSKQ